METPTYSSLPAIQGDIFSVQVDLHSFHEDEISVKIVDGSILVVEARHEERKDPEVGPVSRHFLHRYRLPAGVDPSAVASDLTTSGILTISMKKTLPSNNEVILPLSGNFKKD